MVKLIPSNTAVFVIETEQKSIHFAEKMCAFLTGRLGNTYDCEKYANAYFSDTGNEPLEDLVDVKASDGFFYPCSEWETADYFDNGVGNIFRKGQEEVAIMDYKKTLISYNLNLISMLEKLGDEKRAKKHKKQLEEIHNIKSIPVYKAYLSVALFFRKVPNKQLIKFLSERVLRFNETKQILDPHYKDLIIIKDCRVINPQFAKIGC